MTFEVKVVKVELSPEENRRRIARIARWLLAVCGDLLGPSKATGNLERDDEILPLDLLKQDPLDEILMMSAPAKSKNTGRR